MAVELLVLYGLAVARLTGLITTDEITHTPRDAILRRLDDTNPLHLGVGYLLTCQWCASIWISAAAAPIAWGWGTHPAAAIPALALALSQATGMLSHLGRR